jgi:hypothetical protein
VVSPAWAPIAHADDALAPIKDVVNGNRNGKCDPLKYSSALEGAAQAYARSEKKKDIDELGYDGTAIGFLGSGDPQAQAIHSAYTRGASAAIVDCRYEEFGVGFVRYDDREVDVVTMVFGDPRNSTNQGSFGTNTGPPPQTQPDPPKQPEPQVVPKPPQDAIGLDIKVSGFNANVTVTNSADLAGKCTYAANPTNSPLLPAVNKNFDIAPKGNTPLTFMAPPPLVTYHVVVACRGSFNGQDVEFGHVEQDVTG